MDDIDFLSNFDKKTKILCGTCTALSLVVTTLLAVGFGAVEPTEYGIKYNIISKQIDTQMVYTGGLQYIGFYNQIITYPATQQILEFSDSSSA